MSDDIMRLVLVAAAACLFVGAAILWNVAAVLVLRALGINISPSLPFRLYRIETPELLAALSGRTINTYVAVSGLLLFACPLFAGLLAYDYVVRRYVQHSSYDVKYAFALPAVLVLLTIFGVRISLDHWQKRRENGIGVAMLAILALKVSTSLMGMLMTVFLVAAAVCGSFAYFAVRRIRSPLSGKQYSTRRDGPVQQNFVSEQFVPGKNPSAEKVAMVQKSMSSGLNVDWPSSEGRSDKR